MLELGIGFVVGALGAGFGLIVHDLWTHRHPDPADDPRWVTVNNKHIGMQLCFCCLSRQAVTHGLEHDPLCTKCAVAELNELLEAS
jgi:hypothetical protein